SRLRRGFPLALRLHEGNRRGVEDRGRGRGGLPLSAARSDLGRLFKKVERKHALYHPEEDQKPRKRICGRAGSPGGGRGGKRGDGAADRPPPETLECSGGLGRLRQRGEGSVSPGDVGLFF